MDNIIRKYIIIQWTLVILTYLIDIAWIKFSSFSIFYNKDFFFYYAAVFSIFVIYFFYKKFRSDPKILSLLLSACWLLSFSVAGVVLSYVAYTTNQPLVTHVLATIDNDLGVRTRDIVLWFHSYGWLNTLFFIFYTSFFFQKPFILIYLSLRGKFTNLQSFTLQYMMGVWLSVFLGALFPAEGTYAYYHLDSTAIQHADLERLYELRQNIVDLRKWNGIITFPSFHVAVACFYIYAFRNEKRIIFIPILILNIFLMVSCVSHGGHFFIDIVGGIVVAMASIAIETLLYKWVARSSLKDRKAIAKLNPLSF